MVTTLLAVLVLVGLGPLTSVAWKLIDISREELTTSHREFQLLLASTIAQGLDIHVVALRGQLDRISRALGGALARGEGIDAGDIGTLLADAADDRMLYLRFVPLRGPFVDSRDSARVPEELEPLFIDGFRKGAESLTRGRAARTSGATVSDPILLAGDPPRAAILLASPIVSGGAFRGVLLGLVDLQTVWDEVVAGNLNTGHAIFAVDARGRLFASFALGDVEPGSDFRRSPIVRRFLENPGKETLPFESDHEGYTENYLGSYQATAEGWGVFVQAKRREVYIAVQTMLGSTLSWALAALSLATLAAVFFAKSLATPLNRLAEASRAFARGDFSARVHVRSRNEVGELAETFNGMAAELEDKIRRLKQSLDEQNELFLGTARAMAEAIDAKDPYTRGHSVRVNRYSVILARYQGLTEQEIRDIHVASLLHDVGKIGIDDAILKKPAPLTRDEFEIMKQHPALGASILAPIRQMKPIVPGLRSHHERWGGGGYPDGLAGDAIPLMARIITVADTFDAMTTDRPYQKGMTFEDALARLNELKGVVLDERIVEAFNRAYRAGEFGSFERGRATVATPASV